MNIHALAFIPAAQVPVAQVRIHPQAIPTYEYLHTTKVTTAAESAERHYSSLPRAPMVEGGRAIARVETSITSAQVTSKMDFMVWCLARKGGAIARWPSWKMELWLARQSMLARRWMTRRPANNHAVNPPLPRAITMVAPFPTLSPTYLTTQHSRAVVVGGRAQCVT
jgi:hypothetical protein